jgi:hypothetical protein
MRKAEGGRRKAEGGRRKAEGGRRKAEGWNRFAQSFLLNKMAENSKYETISNGLNSNDINEI